jgi:hypothetical protein
VLRGLAWANSLRCPPVAGGHLSSYEITSITSDTALQNKETFDVFGSKQSFFWASHAGDEHALVRRTLIEPRYSDKSNPSVIMKFRSPGLRKDIPDALRALAGWSPQSHLVHEFVTACLDLRPSLYDVEAAKAISIPGIMAHDAAMQARTRSSSSEQSAGGDGRPARKP